MTVIRRENQADFEGIRAVNHAAFKQPDEALLVDALRGGGKAILSLVAEVHRHIIGHLLFSAVHIEGCKARLAGLAPMAIKPRYQRRGIGTE